MSGNNSHSIPVNAHNIVPSSAPQQQANGLQSAQRRETIVISGNPPPPGFEGVGVTEKWNNHVEISDMASRNVPATFDHQLRSTSATRNMEDNFQSRLRAASATPGDLCGWQRRVPRDHQDNAVGSESATLLFGNYGGRTLNQHLHHTKDKSEFLVGNPGGRTSNQRLHHGKNNSEFLVGNSGGRTLNPTPHHVKGDSELLNGRMGKPEEQLHHDWVNSSAMPGREASLESLPGVRPNNFRCDSVREMHQDQVLPSSRLGPSNAIPRRNAQYQGVDHLQQNDGYGGDRAAVLSGINHPGGSHSQRNVQYQMMDRPQQNHGFGGNQTAIPSDINHLGGNQPNFDSVRHLHDPVLNSDGPRATGDVSHVPDCAIRGSHGGHKITCSPLIRNEVDSWIDDLDVSKCNTNLDWTKGGISPDMMMSWMVQQYLPQIDPPTFDGSPGDWVDFITKFRDLVHRQEYLNDAQRMRLLLQVLRGEARRAVKGYANDSRGYVLALKKIKYLFGQRPMVAQAVLTKVTKGKAIQNDDVKGLSDLLYSLNDCLITLTQLNYESDLHSSDTLRQAVQRLPPRLLSKWSERTLSIRRIEEPNLKHLHSWLEDRLLAMKELHQVQRPSQSQNIKKNAKEPNVQVNLTSTEPDPPAKAKNGSQWKAGLECKLCKENSQDANHRIWKCRKFKVLPPPKKAQCVYRFKLCLNCMTEGHEVEDCPSTRSCFEPNCKERHHTLLHSYFLEKGRKQEADKDNGAKDGAGGDEKKVGMTLQKKPRKKVILQIVPVTLHAADGTAFDTHALLDTCSEVTLVRDDVITKLGLKAKEVTKGGINISTVKDKPEPLKVSEISLKVSARGGDSSLEVESAYAAPAERFNMPRRPSLSDSKDVDLYTHLDGIDLHEITPEDISILIGGDVPEAHLHLEVRRGSEGQPLAIRTPFGWCLFGPKTQGGEGVHCGVTYNADEVQSFWDPDEKPPSYHVNLLTTREDEDLHQSLEKFWAQQHCGIVAEEDLAMSKEDVDASLVLEEETTNIGNRYEVPMLWSEQKVKLPNNLPVAMKRFRFLKRRFEADGDMHKGFKGVIDGYLSADPPFARKLSKEEAEKTSDKTYYLPMHPVVNPNKPGKIRVVNDAAAEYMGTSLNKSLKSGPDLLSSLVGILMRFRVGRIAITADIEAMFHQVRVRPKDADSLRFLWKEDMFSNDPPETFQMLVHIFGAKDSPTCCNYALKRTARDNSSSYEALTIETALKSFYVDDLLKSVHDEKTAVTLALELISLLQRGGFRLCKFMSNCQTVLEALPESEVSQQANIDLDSEPVQRALGVSWDTKEDVLTFTLVIDLIDADMTKRGILRITCRIFDPLGLLAPFILKAKLLLQELWRLGFEWDQHLNEAQEKYWKKWLEGAKQVSKIRLSRQYVTNHKPVEEIQLHIFSDASELAYGSVGYLRFSYKEGGHECAFIMSKNRLAPIKAISLPRLELNAARTGARLSKLILREIDLPIQHIQFWRGSTLTQQYINNTKHQLKPFFANRQTEILELSDAKQWRHVPGEENPADVLSRGVMSPDELNSSSWFKGAGFLLKEEEHWPKSIVHELDDNDDAVRNKVVLVALGMVGDVDRIDMARFSSWLRLKRVFAWTIRFISNCRTSEENREADFLTVKEINNAEHVIIKDVQAMEFKEEISRLSKSQQPPKSSKLAPLCPFVDKEGVLRVGGRLGDLAIPMAMKHPPILGRKHPATRLLIDWTHRRNGHVGPDHVLALLRKDYWIVSARIAINQVVQRCFFCRVRRARKQFPFMANLPQCRAAIGEPPFSHCGVDCIGPVLIKQGRKKLKRWIVLFTCLTIRCVHLEIVEDSETDSFINSLRRFVNRRGSPGHMYSDNGSNFKGASNELKEFVRSLDKKAITDFATKVNIQWSFNPPKAPHMGGAWERLVRSVKEVMFGLVKDHVLTDPQLLTFLTEAEAITNSRPLTYLSDDSTDLGALTPNHLLLGRHRNWASIRDTSEVDICSRKKYKQVQALSAMFWSRWTKEYLPTLTARPKGWREHVSNAQEGDLVLLQDDDVKRGLWPLARVTKVMPGKDGVTRVAEVRTKSGVYTRPVTKLYQLEDHSDVRQGGEDVGNDAN